MLVDTKATARYTNVPYIGSAPSIFPQNPKSLQDLVIEDQWITTGGDDPHNVLIYDKGVDASSRMVVIATDEGL